MKTRFAGSGSAAVFALSVILLQVAAAAAGNDPVADVIVTPGQISWTPKVQAERWLLTVSGQGVYLREVVAAGEPLRLAPVAPDGERLADGNYTWELRAIGAERRESIAERDQKPTSIRQRSERREITFERRPVERPVVTSGSFRVEGGALIAPLEKETEERR